MRILFSIAFCMFLSAQAFSQEVKINPIGILFGNFDGAYEHFLSESWGVEGLLGFQSAKTSIGTADYKLNAFSIGATAKHYFNPRMGADRFHVGAYTRFSTGSWKYDTESIDNTRLALGVFIGQKWVSKGNIVIELDFGAGRAFLNNYSDENFQQVADIIDIDIFGRLALGYRFGEPPSK